MGDVKLRPEILAFAEAMELKLQKKDAIREHWSRSTDSFLFTRAVEEIGELARTFRFGTIENVLDECVDVANFVMMIFNNTSTKSRKLDRIVEDDSSKEK